jgi:uncharacterized damage-inducible protein DinB
VFKLDATQATEFHFGSRSADYSILPYSNVDTDSEKGSSMTSKALCLLAVTVVAVTMTFAPVAKSQDKPTAASAAPSSGARAEFLAELAYYEERFTRLAEAVPADKYSWRPAEGVRSIGEVYAHIVAANYGIARAFGTQPPAGIDPKSITATAGDKAKDVQGLKDSFAHFRQAILALSDADNDKPMKMFGRQTTQRGAFIMVTGHTGEHLGQSIAYARTNGIVPPWTEEQQQQQKSADKPKP